MRKLVLFLLALGTVAAQKADLSGHYYLQNVREVGSELLLRPDGSFEFMFAAGAADYTAKGTWRAEKDAVILNSASGKDAPPFGLTRSSATNEPAILVRIVAPNGRGVPNIDIVLGTDKGPLKARTDSTGEAEFPKDDPARTVAFSIRVYQLETEPIKVNPAHNDFTFEINGAAITQVPFKNERLTVRGKALILRYFDPKSEMSYQKQ